VPQKRKLQTKSTSARSEQSRDARFLFGLRQARDETASEFRDDLRSARTMGELRRGFASRLKRWCKTFPALLAGYAQTLCERGLGIEEVEGELENAWSKIKSEAKNWTALAYDGELPTPDWRAQCYLAGFPSLAPTQKHIPIAMMHGRLDANETERIIATVQSSIQEHHDVTYDAALDHARKCVVKQDLALLSVPRRKESTPDGVIARNKFHQSLADLIGQYQSVKFLFPRFFPISL
jgi:hypothetical protein